MGVVVDSPQPRRLGAPAGKPAKPDHDLKRRPSLKEDSSPMKPKRRSHEGVQLPADFAPMVARFGALTGGGTEPPHVACLVLLLSCRYDTDDIVTTLAMASANVLRQEEEFNSMGQRERSFLSAIHIYLAHVFVFDECVPLRYWHEWAFSKYCTFGCLNRTLGKLLQLMDYRPTVDADIILHNAAWLRGEEEYALAAPLKGKW